MVYETFFSNHHPQRPPMAPHLSQMSPMHTAFPRPTLILSYLKNLGYHHERTVFMLYLCGFKTLLIN